MEPSNSWSADLQKLTKEALEEKTFPPMPEGVPFKHIDGAFGLMKIEDAINQNWVIENRKNGEVTKFDSVDDLLKHGWALD